jgi:hypothetical protein
MPFPYCPLPETYVILERDSLISVAQTQRFLFFAEQHLNELIGAQCQADPCLGGPPLGSVTPII